MSQTSLHAPFLLLLAAALWAGCTAETANPAANGEPATTEKPGGDEEQEEEEEADAGAATPTRDAGKPKKDAGQTPPDAGAGDAAAVEDAGTDASSCWPFPCSTSDAGPKDSGSTACNNVAVAVVTPKAVTGSGPSLGGGALVDGVYTLKASTRYISGTSGTTFPAQGEGVTISGSTLELRITAPGFGVSVSYNYTFTAAGNKLTLTRTCPSAATETWTYDVDGKSLVIHGMPQTNGIWYQTFERP